MADCKFETKPQSQTDRSQGKSHAETQAGDQTNDCHIPENRARNCNILRYINQRTDPSPSNDSLENVNQALIDHKDIKIPPFLNARFSLNNNLVLTTGLNHKNMDYKACLPIICHTLMPLGKGTAHINERWTKFIAHEYQRRLLWTKSDGI
jgi:hypothetical protein